MVVEDERRRVISNENRTPHESDAFKDFQRYDGPLGPTKERSGAKVVEEGNKYYTECNKDGHTREGCFKLIGYPEWWPRKKGEKTKGKVACVEIETGPILGVTYKDYQLFLKHFSRLANGKSLKPTANMAHKENKETSLEEIVVIPNGESIPVKGKGDHTLLGGAKVKGVLYIPDFKCRITEEELDWCG
uniref:Uncharacterized protein n=1 Tax=Tanacetum cinerariifolium TaxID=118510 RepID=A0A6L2K9H7_TANCI|nr:hypothetical protein [Tanacetum cinerariifolium]